MTGLGWRKPARLQTTAERNDSVGFVVDGRLVARHGYEILNGEAEIGHVTSGSMSPCLNKNIGLGYIRKEYTEPGTNLKIKVRNDFINAEVVKIPFVGKD